MKNTFKYKILLSFSFFSFMAAESSQSFASQAEESFDTTEGKVRNAFHELQSVEPLELNDEIMLHLIEKGEYQQRGYKWRVSPGNPDYFYKEDILRLARNGFFSSMGHPFSFVSQDTNQYGQRFFRYHVMGEGGEMIPNPENPDEYIYMPGMEYFINLSAEYLPSENHISSIGKLQSVSLSEEKEVKNKLIPLPVKENLSFKMYQIPNRPSHVPHQSFYTYYSPKRGLWVGIECLNSHTVSWWKRRLAYDADMLLGKEVHFEQNRVLQMSQEEINQQQEAHESFSRAMGGESGTFDPLPLYIHEAYALMKHKGETTEEFESLREKYSVIYPGNARDYLSAWRGFDYNLNYPDGFSWAAYISTQPVKGPLYNEVNVMSPHIKMAMTVRVGDEFYSPLGIYKSPIGQFYDQANSDTSCKNLAIFFHSAVAELVDRINPKKVKSMVVRPLKHMGGLLKASSIPFASSSGTRIETNLPHIRYRGFGGENGEIDFSNNPFVLVNPQEKEAYLIASDHWFATSPFLGGKEVRDNKDIMTAFPYMTVDRQQLASLLKLEAEQKN